MIDEGLFADISSSEVSGLRATFVVPFEIFFDDAVIPNEAAESMIIWLLHQQLSQARNPEGFIEIPYVSI